MFVVIVLIILFLFVVKSSNRNSDNILDPSQAGRYTRLKRYPNKGNKEERCIRRDKIIEFSKKIKFF